MFYFLFFGVKFSFSPFFFFFLAKFCGISFHKSSDIISRRINVLLCWNFYLLFVFNFKLICFMLLLFQVFDGHGGKHAADFACYHLPKLIVNDEDFPRDVEKVVASAFLQTDIAFAEACSLDAALASGTTALAALVIGRWVSLPVKCLYVLHFTSDMCQQIASQNRILSSFMG